MMTESIANELDLRGEEDSFILQGIGDVENTLTGQIVVAELISMDRDFTYPLKRVRVIPVITEGVTATDWRPLLAKHGIQGHEPSRNGKRLLIPCRKHKRRKTSLLCCRRTGEVA